MNLAPSEATCSLVAGRTSVAETMAPSRRAVAIACRPATPTPMMNTLRRRHRARRRHHHRHGLAEHGGGIDHGLVAGEVGLARQHVHRLRAGDARHELHGHQRGAGAGQRLEARRGRRRAPAWRRRWRRASGPSTSSARWPAHLEEDVGAARAPRPALAAMVGARGLQRRRRRSASGRRRPPAPSPWHPSAVSFLTVSGETATRGSPSRSAVTAIVTMVASPGVTVGGRAAACDAGGPRAA